jgi:hypothetical protein
MKFKIFFCQFPNPLTLRVSGMGGYNSKCEKSQNHCILLEGSVIAQKECGPININLPPSRDAGVLKISILLEENQTVLELHLL